MDLISPLSLTETSPTSRSSWKETRTPRPVPIPIPPSTRRRLVPERPLPRGLGSRSGSGCGRRGLVLRTLSRGEGTSSFPSGSEERFNRSESKFRRRGRETESGVGTEVPSGTVEDDLLHVQGDLGHKNDRLRGPWNVSGQIGDYRTFRRCPQSDKCWYTLLENSQTETLASSVESVDPLCHSWSTGLSLKTLSFHKYILTRGFTRYHLSPRRTLPLVPLVPWTLRKVLHHPPSSDINTGYSSLAYSCLDGVKFGT